MSNRYYYITPVPTNKIVVYTSPIVISLFVANHISPDTVRYVQLFDRDTLPPDTTQPEVSITIGPDGVASYTPWRGRRFSNGLVVGLSGVVEQFLDSEAEELHFFLEGRTVF